MKTATELRQVWRSSNAVAAVLLQVEAELEEAAGLGYRYIIHQFSGPEMAGAVTLELLDKGYGVADVGGDRLGRQRQISF